MGERETIEQAVDEITHRLWEGSWGIEVARRESSHEKALLSAQGCYHATIEIAGAWQGPVEILIDEPLGNHVGHTIFGCSDLDRELILDSLRELVNVTGGNLKSLLPEPCTLGLPFVTLPDMGPKTVSLAPVTTLTYETSHGTFTVVVGRTR